jgi:hypothetical protein
MIKIYNNPLCYGNPPPPKLSSTIKVIQLTGDIDRETGKETLKLVNVLESMEQI